MCNPGSGGKIATSVPAILGRVAPAGVAVSAVGAALGNADQIVARANDDANEARNQVILGLLGRKKIDTTILGQARRAPQVAPNSQLYSGTTLGGS